MTQEMNEAAASAKTQLDGVNANLAETQGEVNNLQQKLVETNSAAQQQLTEKQKETDAQILQLKQANKQKMTDAAQLAEQDKNDAVNALQATADKKVEQIAANANVRIENQRISSEKTQARLQKQKDRLQTQVEKEQANYDDVASKLRKAESMNAELKQAIIDNTAAQKQAAASAATTFALPGEAQVAASETAPINMKFVGVLVGVNALLGCVAFTYYSESKKLQSFQANFLEEF